MNNDKKIFNQRTTSFLEFDTNVPHNIFIRNVKLLRIGQIVVNFDILLEKSRIIFHGSPDINKIRTVRGKVRLEVAGKLNVKEIILSLVGDYNISLDLINDISSSPSSLSLPENQGTIFSSSILLENKRILPPGVHEFYFEFLLPGNLPESMCSDAILCKYFLKAELVTRFADELSTDKNKLIDVADLFIERAILETDESIKHGLKPTRFIGGNNDLLDFEFILPKIMKLNSSSIEFIGRWDGFNRVDKISFCFVQSECYSIAKDKCIAHSEKSIAGPFQFQLPKREPLKLQSRPMIFKLPICKSFVNDYDLVNVKIRHQLNVKIQLNNFRKDQIEFSIPISIKSTIPDLDTLPLPRRIDLSNSVACLQLGNKIYTSKSSSSSLSSSSSPSSSKRININKQSIFKLPSKIFNDNNGDEIDTNEISTFDDESNFIRPSKSLSNIRKQMFQILSKTTSRNKNPSLFDDTEQKAKVFNNNDNDNDISKNITGNGVIINVNNSGISTITESSSEFSVEGDDDVINDDKDVKYNNIRRDCGNDDDDIKANTTITAATTATYTNNTLLQNNNNKFNASEFPKPNFVTSSANIIAENFMKFNYLLQQKHYQNKKNIHNNHIGTTTNNNNNEENNNDDETNRQLQYKDHRHHRPPPTKLPKRNSRTSRASSVSTCVPPDARDYVKNLNHYKYINNHHNSNINDNVIS